MRPRWLASNAFLAAVYFSLALIPATLCCFLAALTARRDTERVARAVAEESEDSRAIPPSTSTPEAGMKMSVPAVRGQALQHPSSGKKQE